MNDLNSNALIIDAEAKTSLSESAKWANVLSIVGFVLIALFAIVILSTAFAGSGGLIRGLSINEIGVLIGPLLVLGFFIYPTIKLYKYGKHAKNSVVSASSSELNKAFENLKSLIRFLAIVILLFLVFYTIDSIRMIISNSY